MIILFCAKIAPDRKFTTSSPQRWPSPSRKKAVIGQYPVWCGVWRHIIPKMVPSCFGLKIEYTFFIKHFVLVTCIQTNVSVVLSRRTFFSNVDFRYSWPSNDQLFLLLSKWDRQNELFENNVKDSSQTRHSCYCTINRVKAL